jgi:hypothetical protein
MRHQWFPMVSSRGPHASCCRQMVRWQSDPPSFLAALLHGMADRVVPGSPSAAWMPAAVSSRKCPRTNFPSSGGALECPFGENHPPRRPSLSSQAPVSDGAAQVAPSRRNRVQHNVSGGVHWQCFREHVAHSPQLADRLQELLLQLTQVLIFWRPVGACAAARGAG